MPLTTLNQHFSVRPGSIATGPISYNNLIDKPDLSELYPKSNPSGFITGIQNLVYTTGNQRISGVKTFANSVIVEDSNDGISTLFVSGQNIGINNENPTSALDVSGLAKFNERPFVNGTGILLSGEFDGSLFYPRSNPSGYIRSTQTGAFYPASNPSSFITGVNLSNYVTSSETGAFYPASNPSGFITGVNLSNYVTSSETGAFYPASNPSSFITGVNLSNYVTSSETGAFYPASNPSGFITGVNLSNYVTSSQTGVFATTASLSNLVSTSGAQTINGTKTFTSAISSSLTVPRNGSVIFNDSFGSDYMITGGVNDKLFLQAGGTNILEIDNTNGYPIWKFKDSIGSNSRIGVFTDNPVSDFHVNGTITADRISAAVATTSQSGLMSATDKASLNSAVFATGDQTISGIKTFASKPTVNGTPVLISGEAGGGSSISRGTASVTTTSIPASGTFNTTVDFGCKSYGLLSVSGVSGAWVKLYYDTASRTSDETRTIDQDPSSNVFLMAESLSTGNALIRFAPSTIGYNEGANNLIPIAISNTRNTAATYTIAFNFLKLET